MAIKTCRSCQAPTDPRDRYTTGYCKPCAFTEFGRAAARHRWEERPWFTGRASTVRQLSPVEAAWIGAMLEGEGNFNICEVETPDTRTKLSRKYAVKSSSTEVETIATVLRLVGDGNVQTYQSPRPRHKRAWSWEMQSRRSILALLPQIIPYLTSKREVAEAMYAELVEHMSQYKNAEGVSV